jgi:hypothetical protein
MSIYYPIEYIPEISTTNKNLTNTLNITPSVPTPQTRNFLRNNLPYEETNNENKSEKLIDHNKVITGITSSLTGGETTYGLTSNPDTKNTSNDKSTNSKERRTRVNIDSRLRNTQPQHILDTTLNNLENCLFFTKDSNKIIIYKQSKREVLEWRPSVAHGGRSSSKTIFTPFYISKPFLD